MNGTIVVTGATGKTGRRVVERLRARGRMVRPASRGAGFAWEEPGTWDPALAEAEAVYIAYAPDLAAPGGPETVAAFARRATALGVRRLVLLSGRGEPAAQRAEEAVRSAAPATTVLRCAWFAQNFSEDFMADGVRDGLVALPVDVVPEPFVDVEDVADVAVAALVEPGHGGALYELTGPRALRFEEAVATIARASGRPIAFEAPSFDDFAAGLGAAGVPADTVALMRHLFTEVLDGRNARPADGVRAALGRAPRDFAEYAARTALAGAWGPAAVHA